MIVDVDKYIINRKFVQEWFLDHGKEIGIGLSISIMANATMCPCIVCAVWIGEVTNWPEEILVTIDRLKKFYNYSEIINKPEGCPI